MEGIREEDEAMNAFISQHSQIGGMAGEGEIGGLTPDKLIRPLSSCDSGYTSANLIADSPDQKKSIRGGSVGKRRSLSLGESLQMGNPESPARQLKVEKRKLVFSPSKIVVEDLNTSEELELVGQEEKVEIDQDEEIEGKFLPLKCSTPTIEDKSLFIERDEVGFSGFFLETDDEEIESDFEFLPLSDSDKEELGLCDSENILNTGMIEYTGDEIIVESNGLFADYVEEYAKKIRKHFASS